MNTLHASGKASHWITHSRLVNVKTFFPSLCRNGPLLLRGLIFGLLWANTHQLSAATSAVALRVSSHTANPGDVVKAQVSMGPASNVTSLQFTLQWDATVLGYLTNGDYGLSSLDSGNFNTALAGTGKLPLSWDDPSATGVTQPNEIILFTINLLVIGQAGAGTTIAFTDSPTPREAGVNAERADFLSQNGQVVIPGASTNDLAAALNTPSWIWRKGGAAPWLTQNVMTHDGVCAGQSGAIKDSYDSWVETTNRGPGTVSFWWKVSSETNNDRLRFYVNGSEKMRISGEVDWQWRSYDVPAGSQILRWRYSKSSSTTKGQDRGWLDQVQYAPMPPTITTQPLSQTVEAGMAVSFKVTAGGAPPLVYQWWANGAKLTNAASIRGATNATLVLSNVQTAQAGTYWVVVSNLANTVTSSNASLTVLPVFSLPEALDTPGWVWRTGGSAPWKGLNSVTHDGVDAACSGTIGNDQESWMETTVSGPGTLGFWWKVSCETNNDRLRLYLNGTEKLRITGEVDWQWRSLDLPSGSQVLRWRYSKSSSTAKGQDRGWVDQAQFVTNIPAPPPNQALGQPVTMQINISQSCVILNWNVTPDKIYQVLYKENLADAEWRECSGEVLAKGSSATFIESLDAQTQRFYRILEY